MEKRRKNLVNALGQKFLGAFFCVMYAAFSQAQPVAYPDTVRMISGSTRIIDVLANDNLDNCTYSTVHVSVMPAASGAAVAFGADNKLAYTPPAGFAGREVLTYTVTCGASSGTASVYITVYNKPDNITGTSCYVAPPPSIWDMEQKVVSSRVVYWLATPFVGDLDKDGRLEVVVPGVEEPNHTASSILIFNDSLKLKRRIDMPAGISMPEENTMTFLIADTDNDGFGEIVVCTTDKKLRCYSHTGSVKWVSDSTYGGNATYCPSLIVADIDGDGKCEILSVDKIFAGESGKELVTLPAGGRGFSEGSPKSYMPVFADVDNDGIQEVVAGNTVYRVTISNRNGTSGNTATVLAKAPNSLPDGFTSVADIDLDGDPDVIVTGGGSGANTAVMYVWDGATSAQIGSTITVTSNGKSISRPFVGDINKSGYPDIAFTYVNRIEAYWYDPVAKKFVRLWQKITTDSSGATTMSMFDFDQDGEVELVYRDESKLHIIDKSGNDKVALPCGSLTHTEYPVIVDLDQDGHADILVSGNPVGYTPGDIRIVRYGSKLGKWAPARPVWNQHGYNSLNINDDLSVPKCPLNPATVFPGADGQLGTANDVRPFNNFLQQQTTLNSNGMPYWPVPDAVPVESESRIIVNGNIFAVVVAVHNQGDEKIGSPVHVTLYNETVSAANKLAAGSSNEVIPPQGTGYVFVTFSSNALIVKIVVRVNDNNGNFPYYRECKEDNNEMTFVNHVYHRYMQKNASVDNTPGNGKYGNPVSVLYTDTVHYEITAHNVNQNAGTVIIRETLPADQEFVSGSAAPSGPGVFQQSRISGTPPQDILMWTLNGIAPLVDTVVSYNATPVAGACVSQPLFENHAWITTGHPLVIETVNSTYHQGAGASLLLFSAGHGGSVYNAQPQVLDYRTSAGTGVLAVPDDGYAFTGWSHDDYYSLRSERIPAKSGIMYYDTLVIFGNVELAANFELIRYPIRYYLNGGENAGNNPDAYTIKSGVIMLEEPYKAGDVFTGWTGSNGAEPQKTVTIPEGSTGELEFYANYLYSDPTDNIPAGMEPDKIWGAEDELFIRTSRTGSIVRIYSMDGIPEGLHTIMSTGVTRIKLQRGIHIVTLNNGAAQKIIIE
jgi:uncharacterized repeat protein (TIGR02543 family)